MNRSSRGETFLLVVVKLSKCLCPVELFMFQVSTLFLASAVIFVFLAE